MCDFDPPLFAGVLNMDYNVIRSARFLNFFRGRRSLSKVGKNYPELS